MKLYYKNELCTLVNGDAFDCMNNMIKQEVKVSTVLTSPPYNTGRADSSKRAFENYESRYDIYLDSKTQEEYLQWSVDLFKLYGKILEPNGVILYNISYGSEDPNTMWLFPSEVIRNTEFMVAESIVWKKKSCIPNNVSPNKLSRIVEYVFVFCRKSEYKTFNCNKVVKSVSRTNQKYYENIFNFIEAANNDGSNNLNKATFSSELVNKLLDIYYSKGTVYDSFSGTGTTMSACQSRGIKSIGSELSEAQCEFTKERLEKNNE